QLFGGESERVFADPILFVNVLYVLCKAQADSRNVSDYDFGAAMNGDALEDASIAILEEVADFSPSQKREVLRQVIRKGVEAAGIAISQARDFIEKFDPKEAA